MWVVALQSSLTSEPILVKRNLSRQPIRFTDSAVAERMAHEYNQTLSHAMKQDNLSWVVMEDNRFYESDWIIPDEDENY